MIFENLPERQTENDAWRNWCKWWNNIRLQKRKLCIPRKAVLWGATLVLGQVSLIRRSNHLLTVYRMVYTLVPLYSQHHHGVSTGKDFGMAFKWAGDDCFVYRCCKGRPISAVNRKESWNWCKATDDWCQVQLVWYRKVDPCLCCNCIPSIVLSQSVQFGEELHHMCSRLRFPTPLATGHEWHERDDMNDMNVHDSWGPDYRLPCYALCTLKWKLIWMCLSQWIKDED